RGRQEPSDASSAAIVVTLEKEEQPEEDRREAATADRGAFEPERPAERDWTSERVFTLGLRVPTGADQLDRVQLNPDEIARVIHRAVDRAYPFLEREGIRANFLWAVQGRALDVRLVIPEKLGWTSGQLRSPGFQQRFLAGFHQALAQIAPA